MNDWITHFGAFTDFTYDMAADEKESVPIGSSTPESILNLPKIILDNNESQEETILKNEKSKKYRNFPSQMSVTKSSPRAIDGDDIDFSDDSSSSSADFEIETLYKRKKDQKKPKIKMNKVIYSFQKPEPEVRKIFVTSRAPRSKNNEKISIKREYIHLKTRLTSRRKIPLSSMVHQHELMIADISDLENKK